MTVRVAGVRMLGAWSVVAMSAQRMTAHSAQSLGF
jgi:hypothetical protein